MENFIRIIIWVGILYLGFPANSFPLRLEESNIELMREGVKCEPDSKFYTPANVRPGCVIAALECVAAELRTVSYECEDPEEVIDLAQEFLTHTVRYLKKDVKVEESNSSACICESWPEKPFNNFLDAAQSLLEEVKSGAITSAEVS